MSHEYKFVFVNVRKAGSSTVRHLLNRTFGATETSWCGAPDAACRLRGEHFTARRLFAGAPDCNESACHSYGLDAHCR